MKQFVSIIMPALNEAECIANTVSSIPRDEFIARGYDTEILVVDNGSTDGTAENARNAGAQVVSEPQRGYGNAYMAGFKEAKGSIICTLDSDGSYPSAVLPDLVDKLIKEELDFISTNRLYYLTNGIMPLRNKIGNAILNLSSRVLFHLPFKDSQSGMWIFRSELLAEMQLKANGMALSQEIKIEAAWRLKVRCEEIPIHYGYRNGVSKLRLWRDGSGNLFYMVRKRFD